MKKHYYLILISFINIFVSCNSDFNSSPDIVRNSNSIRDNNYKVLQERLAPLPRFKDRRGNKLRTLSSDAPDLTKSPYNKLGAIYHIGNGFIGDPENIGNNGIIDIESMLKDVRSKKFLHNTSINTTELALSAYSSNNEMTYVNNNSYKIDASADLNLWIFKTKITATYNKIFNTSHYTKNDNFYGKIDLIYKYQKINIEDTDIAMKTIAYRNLDDNFLYSIYMGSIEDYLESNGFLVLSNFYTGARLTALYHTNSTKETSSKLDSTSFDSSIKTSFKWGSVGGDLKIGFTKNEGSQTNNNSTSNKLGCYIKAFGGAPGFQSPSNISDLYNSNPIEYGEWYKSLSNKDNLVITDVGNDGIIPISKLVLEKNFKQRINNYISNFGVVDRVYIRENIEPSVKIYPIKATDYDIPTAFVSIETRHGDCINILDNELMNRINLNESLGYNDSYKKDIDDIFQNISKVFKCKIVSYDNMAYCHFYNLDSSYDNIMPNSENQIWKYTTVRFSFKTNGDIYKFRNPNSNIMYVYDRKNKSAFSFYEDDEDQGYITDCYGITEWINSIPEKKISMSDLINNYVIVGL